ncbi:fibrinogen-like YCDxxxxGGGW domain-containing protein [Faecalibacter bovis]|uniref:Uncharacterized protein n=1 Tax=Faecalibacter bovis TaxID=2898187 RepID=A0ABX7XDC8_9FLAO|nr:fibrinogen-like YCDxxxxGGGW domain-containing protein [Faecalibacter bovis]QTV05924.1 hypothetical protein J9309_00820 [Faecalibacter bovis]
MFRFLLLFLPFMLFAQIGVNTENPHHEADLHLASKNKTLILNHVDDFAKITNPYLGMIVYDYIEHCFKGYQLSGWSDCFGAKQEDPVVRVDGPGFKGTYIRGQQLTDATYEVTITNNTFREATLGFNLTDLEIDQSDITVTMLSIPSEGKSTTDPQESIDITIPAGSSRTIVYKLSGTLNAPYTKLTGIWNKIILSHEDEQEIEYIADCNNGTWVTDLPLEDDGLLKNGKTYNLIYTVPIPNSEGYSFEELNITKDGLTLTREVVSGSLNGILRYTITGTYTGLDFTPAVFGNFAGCYFAVGRYPYHCKEIKNLYPNSLSGVYTIDLDGNKLNVPALQAYCDMEPKATKNNMIDNGGWTLVLNYNHLGGTNPVKKLRNDSFPILKNSTHGYDESNTEAWGQTSKELLQYYPIVENETELRIFGSTNQHSRVIHFKSRNINIVKAFIYDKTLSYEGIKTNHIQFINHNGLLPQSANSYSNTILSHTFYNSGKECWNMGTDGRWEVDNYFKDTNGWNYHTLHQVWIK